MLPFFKFGFKTKSLRDSGNCCLFNFKLIRSVKGEKRTLEHCLISVEENSSYLVDREIFSDPIISSISLVVIGCMYIDSVINNCSSLADRIVPLRSISILVILKY